MREVYFTSHAGRKMRRYGLSESRVKRVVRFPSRTEEGIAPKTIAVMQPAGTKNYQEIWVMYQIAGRQSSLPRQPSAGGSIDNFGKWVAKNGGEGTVKIITAWRYPGKSPERNPVPGEILEEIRGLIF